MKDSPPTTVEPNAGARAWLAFASCSAIWGSTFLVIRFSNDALAPMWASAIRLVLAAVLLALWCVIARIAWPRGAALRTSIVYGALTFGINMPLLYWAEQTVPSGLSAVMYATTPLSTALMARALGTERLSLAKIAGAVIALGGVALLFSGGLRGHIPPVGLAAVFVAATSSALAATLFRRGPRQNVIAANAVACAVGAAFSLAGSFALRESHVTPLTPAVLLPLIYLTIAGSLGAFVLYSWLVSRWPVTRSSFVSVVVPIIALSLGALVRHEHLTAAMFAGSALVLIGLLLGMRGAGKRAH
jgi:drug/metabolite transporter (DMT)-like permease